MTRKRCGKACACASCSTTRSNPRPKAWAVLPPSSPYPQPQIPAPCNGKHVGAVVPGRGGGQITACATPSAEKPGEGQYWVGLPLPGAGKAIPKRKVSRRLASLRKPRHVDRLEDVSAAVAYQSQADAIPGPTGVELPHDPRKHPCSPGHPLWGPEYQHAVAQATEGALERAGISAEVPLELGPGDVEDLEVPFANPAESVDAIARAELLTHPQGPAWDHQAGECVVAYQKRQRARASRPSKAQARWEESQRKKAAKEAAKKERAWQRKTAAAVRKAQKQAMRKTRAKKNSKAARLPFGTQAGKGYAKLLLNKRETSLWDDDIAPMRRKILDHAALLSDQIRGPVDVIGAEGRGRMRVIASRDAVLT